MLSSSQEYEDDYEPEEAEDYSDVFEDEADSSRITSRQPSPKKGPKKEPERTRPKGGMMGEGGSRGPPRRSSNSLSDVVALATREFELETKWRDHLNAHPFWKSDALKLGGFQ